MYKWDISETTYIYQNVSYMNLTVFCLNLINLILIN